MTEHLSTIDHDSVFKQLLSEFFVEFLDLFAPTVLETLDRDSITFLDKEFFQEIVDPDRREADLVVKAQVRQQTAFVIIHLEHQAQHSADLDRRMFRYFARLYERHNLPIYPLALLSYTSPRRAASDRHQVSYAGIMVLDFTYQVVQLNRLDWRAYLRHTNPLANALLARMPIPKQDRVRAKLEALTALAGLRLTAARRTMLAAFIDTYLALNSAEQAIFQRELTASQGATQEAVMELITSWQRQGREEGRKEGREEGREQGKREATLDLVLRLLNRKLGGIAPTTLDRIAALSVEQLDQLGEALLDFATTDELIAWLDAHPIPSATPDCSQ